MIGSLKASIMGVVTEILNVFLKLYKCRELPDRWWAALFV